MAVVNPSEPTVALRPAEAISRSGALSTLPSPESPVGPYIPVTDVPYARAKRALDIFISAFGLLILAIPCAFVALLIKLTSRGEVIFKQTRVGAGGRLFTCYKFRSMVVDAEKRKHKVMHLNEVSGPVFKIKNDPRITWVGRYLRKFSIDEVPQLYNVLRGDMSIVGPRPPVPQEVATYGPRELGRLAVKPGLTCLWQISGRSNVAFDHWVEMDLAYIETMSFCGDLKIIAQTVPAVLTCRGAH